MSDQIPEFPEDRPKKRKKDGAKKKSVGRKHSLKKELAELFAAGGTALAMVNTYDGMVVLDKSERLAEELNDLAQKNDRVYAALENMLTAGVWSGLVMVTASIAVPIAANHGLVDRRLAPLFGQPMPPEPEPEASEPEGEHAGPEGTPGEATILPAETPDLQPPWEGPQGEPVDDGRAARPVG